MQYTTNYQSPLGEMLLAGDEMGVTGVWFERQKYMVQGLEKKHEERETPILLQVKRWLQMYFSGEIPDFIPPVHMIGTPFQKSVWHKLQAIPYGQTTSYGEIAAQIARERGIERMSAQAVGGAVGHNKISIIIPCHRVVGMDGSLTGYAGGLDKKEWLLQLEQRALREGK